MHRQRWGGDAVRWARILTNPPHPCACPHLPLPPSPTRHPSQAKSLVGMCSQTATRGAALLFRRPRGLRCLLAGRPPTFHRRADSWSGRSGAGSVPALLQIDGIDGDRTPPTSGQLSPTTAWGSHKLDDSGKTLRPPVAGSSLSLTPLPPAHCVSLSFVLFSAPLAASSAGHAMYPMLWTRAHTRAPWSVGHLAATLGGTRVARPGGQYMNVVHWLPRVEETGGTRRRPPVPGLPSRKRVVGLTHR